MSVPDCKPPNIHASLLAVLAMSGFIVRSQPMIRGNVHDTAANPVPFCNVFIQKNGLVTNLTTTDDSGHFVLDSPDTGLFLLAVTSIGYRKHEQIIHLQQAGLSIDVVLIADTVLLDQVIVHGDSPIQIKGDTVVYDAVYFSTGNEVVLADLLEKLPGITVEENGRVKFQGREVTRIQVEDDDLFDNNYQILSKNLSADLVEQVEVLQNYSDNRLLKNIEDSDDIALNLRLKEDRKGRLFGDGRGESDFHERYDARANLVSFSDRIKLYAISSTNNIGTDPTGDMDELLRPAGNSRIPGDEVAGEYLVPVSRPYIAQFKRDRYYFNEALFGSLHGIYRPAKNFKMTLHGHFFRDQTSFFTAKRSDYFAPTDTIRFEEQANAENKERYEYLQGIAEYEISRDMIVRYKTRLNVHRSEASQQNNLNLNNVSGRLESRTNVQGHHLNLTRKFSDRAAATIDFRYLSDSRPQDFTVDGNLVGDYFVVPTSDTLRQSSSLLTRLYLCEVNLFRKVKSGKFGLRAGYEHLEESVNTELASPPSSLAGNVLRGIQTKSYAEGYYAWKVGSFLLTPGVALEYANLALTDRPTFPMLFFNPRLALRWQQSSRNRLSMVYSMGQSVSSTRRLTTSPILTDYNLLAINDDGFRTFVSRTFLVNYELGGWTSGFTVFASLYFKDLPSDYLLNADIEPNYLVTTMNRLADRELSSVSLVADKYFKTVRTNLKVNWSYSTSEFVTSTESVTTPTVSRSHHLDLSLRTALAGPLNIHLGHVLQASTTASQFVEASNYSSLIYLDGYVSGLKGRLNLTVHGERYELISVQGRPVFHFVDFTARYALTATQGLILLLKGRNLLDETVFGERFVSSQVITTSTNRLIPRYVLAGIEFRF